MFGAFKLSEELKKFFMKAPQFSINSKFPLKTFILFFIFFQ